MVQDKLPKIGITGCGYIVEEVHVPCLAKLQTCVVTGFHEIKKENAEALKSAYLAALQKNGNPAFQVAKDECKVYDNLDEMVKAVDVIDIATPTRAHYEGIRSALVNGKHVMCERPMARNWWETQLNKDLKEKAKKVIFQMRNQAVWNPLLGDEAPKLLADQHVIGAVESVRVLNADSMQKHTKEAPDRWDKFQNGGGALCDIGPNGYAVAYIWLGKPVPVSVKAEKIYIKEPEWKIAKVKQKITVEDDAHFIVNWQSKDGKTFSSDIEATRGEKDWWPDGVVKGTKLKNNIYYEARGTKGVLEFPNVKVGLKVIVYFKLVGKDGIEKEIPFPPPEQDIENELYFREFIDAVRGKAKPRTDYDYAEEMLAAFGAAYLSEKLGRKEVTLDEFKKHCTTVAAGKKDPEEQVRAIIADITSFLL
nr:Gfo/Idh/MocA family oxidoreductase [Candidatus Sigynarchaeota archaeon]